MVQQLVRTMDSINGSSKKVVEIISIIDAIAFQDERRRSTLRWGAAVLMNKAEGFCRGCRRGTQSCTAFGHGGP